MYTSIRTLTVSVKSKLNEPEGSFICARSSHDCSQPARWRRLVSGLRVTGHTGASQYNRTQVKHTEVDKENLNLNTRSYRLKLVPVPSFNSVE